MNRSCSVLSVALITLALLAVPTAASGQSYTSAIQQRGWWPRFDQPVEFGRGIQRSNLQPRGSRLTLIAQRGHPEFYLELGLRR